MTTEEVRNEISRGLRAGRAPVHPVLLQRWNQKPGNARVRNPHPLLTAPSSHAQGARGVSHAPGLEALSLWTLVPFPFWQAVYLRTRMMNGFPSLPLRCWMGLSHFTHFCGFGERDQLDVSLGEMAPTMSRHSYGKTGVEKLPVRCIGSILPFLRNLSFTCDLVTDI